MGVYPSHSSRCAIDVAHSLCVRGRCGVVASRSHYARSVPAHLPILCGIYCVLRTDLRKLSAAVFYSTLGSPELCAVLFGGCGVSLFSGWNSAKSHALSLGIHVSHYVLNVFV